MRTYDEIFARYEKIREWECADRKYSWEKEPDIDEIAISDEKRIDEEFCFEHLDKMFSNKKDRAFWIGYWWDTLSEEEEEKAIERAFFSMSEEEQIKAGKELAKQCTEIFKRCVKWG